MRGFSERERELLAQMARRSKAEGYSLTKVFDEYAVKTKRASGSVRNFYYSLLKENGKLTEGLSANMIKPFDKCETVRLIFSSSIFFALAMENGLSAAILNPHSAEMRKAYYTYLLLKGKDKNCANYVENASSFATAATTPAAQTEELAGGTELQKAIRKGFCQKAAELTERLLATRDPLSLVEEEIIPALDQVGKGFESGKLFLPQLLISAEAAKAAFGEIKKKLPAGEGGKGPFVLATVRGDIHDIGKNIVGLLLENYGFSVIDLGKDVPPRAVLQAVREHHAPLVGLSALMTTTVPAMEETVRLLAKEAPYCKVIVGGAVLTEEYARSMGAHGYGKDAMETVRLAESFLAEENA